ncbi:lachesin-like isoform X2 [Agrilus planipennis]|uniref:Lachesin-like isoform X2 n=1 Tax=Agrilus planipennis TaxID=224129 RepID=A0A7F5RFZ2_AGRPL|nr:lachesin-like isoform X2 [Agrilus planipennis]
MAKAWTWVPNWWRSMREWSVTAVDGFRKKCEAFQKFEMQGNTARILLCAILQHVVATGQVDKPPPEFLEPLENHTVTQGRDIYFTCVVNHLADYKVAWIKSDSKAILAIHTRMVSQNTRLSVTHNGHNTWMLHISNVQKNDSGTYMCQINTNPMRSQMGHLEVVIPPDIINDADSSESDSVAMEGGTVRLKCKATGVPEPSLIWRREDNRNITLRHENREKQVIKTFEGDTLVLHNVQRNDMGVYLCIASNGIPPTVSKRYIVKVRFPPLIKVTNQLVAAPLASDVLVQCYVEASPRAMNHWIRDGTGEKLLPSDKYIITETTLSDYSYFMNLTIKSLEKRDFGDYMCSSTNIVGRSEGTVRLQELHLLVKTTTTQSTPKHVEMTKPRKPVVKENLKKPKKKSKSKKGSEEDNVSDDYAITTVTFPPYSWTLAPPKALPVPSTKKTPTWVHHSSCGCKTPEKFYEPKLPQCHTR